MAGANADDLHDVYIVVPPDFREDILNHALPDAEHLIIELLADTFGTWARAGWVLGGEAEFKANMQTGLQAQRPLKRALIARRISQTQLDNLRVSFPKTMRSIGFTMEPVEAEGPAPAGPSIFPSSASTSTRVHELSRGGKGGNGEDITPARSHMSTLCSSACPTLVEDVLLRFEATLMKRTEFTLPLERRALVFDALEQCCGHTDALAGSNARSDSNQQAWHPQTPETEDMLAGAQRMRRAISGMSLADKTTAGIALRISLDCSIKNTQPAELNEKNGQGQATPVRLVFRHASTGESGEFKTRTMDPTLPSSSELLKQGFLHKVTKIVAEEKGWKHHETQVAFVRTDKASEEAVQASLTAETSPGNTESNPAFLGGMLGTHRRAVVFVKFENIRTGQSGQAVIETIDPNASSEDPAQRDIFRGDVTRDVVRLKRWRECDTIVDVQLVSPTGV